MGKKKILVIFALVFILLIGWILGLRAVTHMDEIKKQNSLVKQADAFKERGLYIRAIPLYEEALKVKVTDKKNFEIENKLLDTYIEHGDYAKYAKIVERRAEDNTASVDEYVNSIQYYLDESRMDNAFKLIKKGIENTDDQKIKDIYESYRYIYKFNSTKFAMVLPTADNVILPAFDGEKWGYISGMGVTIIPPLFDEATAFSLDGIAAVAKDGKYYTITTEGDFYGVDDNPNSTRIQEVAYAYGSLIQAKKDGKYGFFDYDFNPVLTDLQFDEVTRASNGVVVGKKGSEWVIVSLADGKQILGGIEDVAVNSYGSVFNSNRAMVKINGEWRLININGEFLCPNGFVDAKAPESDGYIAVADNRGRWGFINSNNGELVIDYEYLDAFSFSDEVAAVQKYNDSWIYISKANAPISDEEFQYALPFQEGIGQVYLEGAVRMITFQYYGR